MSTRSYTSKFGCKIKQINCNINLKLLSMSNKPK